MIENCQIFADFAQIFCKNRLKILIFFGWFILDGQKPFRTNSDQIQIINNQKSTIFNEKLIKW